MQNISYQKSIPVRAEVDLFVAGGGPAGLAAAVTAARQGCRVYLAEGQACFGGMGTAGLVPAFSTFGDGVTVLAAGFGAEVLDRLAVEKHGEEPNDRNGIQPEGLKRVYDSLVKESGMQATLLTQVIDVQLDGRRLDTVICQGKSGLFAVRARMFIDCTGDADLCAWAGVPCVKGDAEDGRMMPGTLCSTWANIEFADDPGKIFVRQILQQAIADGVFTIPDLHHSGFWRTGRTLGGANIGHTFGVDATDERSLTEHLMQARAALMEFQHFYRKYIPGYAGIELAASGSLLGVRESRRIVGEYVLNVDDFKARAVFADEIGRYCYPVDIHNERPSTPETHAAFEKEFRQTLRYNRGESYGIPYRCLVPQGIDNLLVAGRCISTDRKVLGSVRVMPGCYITGQAAGMAAVLCCEGAVTTRACPVPQLQRRLKAIGAALPNCP